jgi:iron complex outermembrane recepter protein
MRLRVSRWRCLAVAGVAASLSAVSFPTLAQEGAIEEIVVTGSYIRRTTADSPSPLTVIDRAQIEQIGAIEIKDIVNRMTFNAGSINSTNAFSGGDNSTGQTNINIRNLGLGSTLVLINGKRFVKTATDAGGNAYVNTSTLIPSIAIERVEVVKDGASALYGSEAVAGVVNFITRSGFEGMELSFDARTDQETRKQDDFTFSGIWGFSGERGSVVVSAEFLERKALTINDRFGDYGGTGLSTLANPGNFSPAVVPGSPGAALIPGSSTAFGVGAYFSAGGIGDLDCDLAAGMHRQSFRSPLTSSPLAGSAIEALNGCIYDFSPFFSLVGAETRFLSHVSGEFDLSPTTQMYGEIAFADAEFSRNNSMFPLVRFPFVPVSNPGVQDDLARRQAALAAAGSPLAGFLVPENFAGVTFLGRPLGFTQAETGTDLRPVDTDTRDFASTYRAIIGLRGDLPFADGWIFDTSLTRSERDASQRNTDTIQQNLLLAVRGFGGPNCNAAQPGVVAGGGNMGDIRPGFECYFYNPYFSGQFKPDGSPQDDPMLRNPRELYEWMIGEIHARAHTEQLVWDFVTTGNVMQLPNGLPLGMAFGLQWVRDEIRTELDDTSAGGGFSFIFGGSRWRAKENTYAAFLEFAIPVTDNFELQLAGRYERFDEVDDDSFDPKLTALWAVSDDLTLRASTGTSFRRGSLLQTNGFSTQLINIADPFSGASLAFRPEIAKGNLDLKTESAFVWNVGLSWAPTEGPLEGLAVDIDYYNYDYEDLIARPGASTLIAQDIASRCPQGLNNLGAPNPDLSRPACGIQSDGSIAFDPNGGPGLPDQVIRDEAGNYLRSEPQFENAQELQTSGVDLTIRYSWEMANLGLFTAGLAGSYTAEYEITDIAGNKIDGAGKRNIGNTIGRSMPQYKANASLIWMRDRHSANTLIRYIHSYKDDQAVQRAADGTPLCVGSCLRAVNFGISNLLNDRISSFTTVDLQYSYELPAWGVQGEGSRITLGGQNVFNRKPPKLNFDGGFDPFVHDSRGAIWYARYTMQL